MYSEYESNFLELSERNEYATLRHYNTTEN